jgi:hypothetical protein
VDSEVRAASKEDVLLKKVLVLGSCFMGLLFLCGFQTAAVAQTLQPDSDKKADPCLESTCRNIPVREELTAIDIRVEKSGIKHLRGIAGGFEQGAGVAGGVQFTTADAIPHLELRATALTSTTLVRRLDLEGVFSFADRRNHADVWFSFMQRQNHFFGIGPRTSSQSKTSFGTDQRSYQASFYRDLADHLQVGVYGQVMNSHSEASNSTKYPPITESFSGTPDQGAARWIPGFLSTPQILSYGGFLEFDTRDKSVDLTRGVDLYGRVASSDGMSNHSMFSDYGWLEGEFDARAHIPLGSSRTSLALRSKGEFKKTKGGSQIPFYDLSYLGGREYVRGYDLYRFRGNNVFIVSAEIRRTVYKKTDHRGVDIFALADSGQVWGDSRSTTDPAILANQDFRSTNWRTGVGGGLDYRHSRTVAARLEVARSNEGIQIYVSMSRGF